MTCVNDPQQAKSIQNILFSQNAFILWEKLWLLGDNEIFIRLILQCANCCVNEETSTLIFNSNLFRNNILPYIENNTSIPPLHNQNQQNNQISMFPQSNMANPFDILVNNAMFDPSNQNQQQNIFQNNPNSNSSHPIQTIQNLASNSNVQQESEEDITFHLLICNIIIYVSFKKNIDDTVLEYELRCCKYLARFFNTMNKDIFLREVNAFSEYLQNLSNPQQKELRLYLCEFFRTYYLAFLQKIKLNIKFRIF